MVTLVEAPSDAAPAETSSSDVAAATGEQPAAYTEAVPTIPVEQQEAANVPHISDGTTAVEPAVADAVASEKRTAITSVRAGRP